MHSRVNEVFYYRKPSGIESNGTLDGSFPSFRHTATGRKVFSHVPRTDKHFCESPHLGCRTRF